MTKKVVINASELHRTAGKLLKRVALQDEHFVVERNSCPIAVLMSYPEYEELTYRRVMEAPQELMRPWVRKSRGWRLSEEDLMAELEKDKHAGYKAAA
jgi:prevent-host-death family protein